MPCLVMNGALCPAGKTPFIGVIVVSPNQTSFDNFVVESSLVAFAIVWGQYKESAKTLQMMSVMAGL